MSGNVSRRELAKGGLAAGLTVGALSTGLVACGSGSDDGTTSTGAKAAGGGSVAPQGPRGTIVIGNAEPPTSAQWDPHAAFGLADYQVWTLVYETLLSYDVNRRLVGGLARSWRRLSPTRLRMTLREGARFSDGSPLTSHDVKASVERIAKPGSDLALAIALPEGATVEVKDELTFDLVTPDVYGPLENSLVSVSIVSRRDAANPGAFKQRPLGSGPYTFVGYENNVVTLRANPGYWGGRPGADGVKIAYIQDPSARLNALMTGQIDIYTRADSIVLDEVRGNPAFNVTDVSPASQFFYIPQFDTALRDVRVRQAIAYAIPRRAIAQDIMKINPPALSSLPAAAQGFRPLEPSFDLDVERAKALLAEAGHGDGLTLTLASANAFQHQERIDQLVKSSLEAIGVTVEIEKLETGTFRSGYSDYALSMNALGTAGDPSWIFTFFVPPVAKAVLKWDSQKEFVPLIDAQLQTLGAEREKAIDAAAQYLWENQIFIYLTDDIWYTVVNSRISDYARVTTEGEPLLWKARVA